MRDQPTIALTIGRKRGDYLFDMAFDAIEIILAVNGMWPAVHERRV